MLRAVTDLFTWVMVGAAAIGALAVFRSKFPMIIKLVGVAALVVLAITFRVFDAKFWGVVIMGGAVIILFFLPWLDKSPVKSIRYRPTWHKLLYAIFVVNFFILGYLGVLPPFDLGQAYSLVGTVFYFAFFALMPIWSCKGEFKPVPDRVTFKPH
jgi:ubiquinol-cytochrome c reductase cytochrome b subunit